MSARPPFMLGLQGYPKVHVKYAVVVIMVTLDEFRDLNALIVHHRAIAGLVE